jgi:diguanylate cyclase (GGDEF)-like protein
MRDNFFLLALLLFTFASPLMAQPSISLGVEVQYEISEEKLWYVSPDNATPDLSALRQTILDTQPVEHSLAGQSGSYITKISVRNDSDTPRTWFINPNATFVDQGIAFWESPSRQNIQRINFSQINNAQLPSLMHSQAFGLTLEQHEQGELWLFINAQHYANPLSISFYSKAAFFHRQLLINSITASSIAVMLTLALITLIIFIRVRNSITLAYAGYVGLHGIGWAAAAGLISDLFPTPHFNTTYWGMLIFPIAVACAAQFTKQLFNCQQEHFKLAKFLDNLCLLCIGIGLVIPWIDFSFAFAASHVVALIWLTTSIAIGYKMLRPKYSRAKYYLAGNLVYGSSLLIYVLTHAKVIDTGLNPSLFVLLALAIDCICILLALSEWLYTKQKDYNRSFYLARIDPLTGTGNRHLLNEKFSELQDEFIIVFIDFDGIKAINDQLGHDKGDLFLVNSARLMQDRIEGLGSVFRTGGDEFVWLFDVKRKQDIPELTKTIQAIVIQSEKELRAQGWKTSGISYGIASSLEGNNQSECLTLADKRMYEHKRSKKADRATTHLVTAS